MSVEIDPQQVIARLAAQIGNLYAELAMKDVALEALQKQQDAPPEPPAPEDTPAT